jgi:proteasome accessory factor B
LVTLLQGNKRYNADDLAQELEVSRRTVFRDLTMLEMARVPYYYDRQRGGYRIDRHFFLPPVNLTLPEALAVLALTRQLRGSSELPLLAHGTRAAMKLQSVLPESVARHVGSVIDRVRMSLSPLARHRDTEALFNDAAGAIAARRVCRMVYISFHERKQIVTTVHPLRLVFHGRAWYVIAWSSKHRQIRTFKLIRIKTLTVTDRTFEPRPDAEIDAHFGDAWSMIPEGRLWDVHARFAPDVAGNVAEVRWHRSQRVEWRDDGGIDFHVRVDGLGEITWWILGYGDRAEVISPPALRRRLAQVAARLLGLYRPAGKEA